jgi:hypothetical protein
VIAKAHLRGAKNGIRGGLDSFSARPIFISLNIRVPLIAYQLRKYFLTQRSPEQIFLSTLDTAYQITLGSPVL